MNADDKKICILIICLLPVHQTRQLKPSYVFQVVKWAFSTGIIKLT